MNSLELIDLLETGLFLGECLPYSHRRTWLHTSNGRLNGDTPWDRLTRGDVRSVRNILSELNEGIPA